MEGGGVILVPAAADALLIRISCSQPKYKYTHAAPYSPPPPQLSPYEDKGAINFRGWARMAVPIKEVKASSSNFWEGFIHISSLLFPFFALSPHIR